MIKYFVRSNLCVLFFVLPMAVPPISEAKADEAAHSGLKALEFLIGEWDCEYTVPAAVPEINAVKGSKINQHLSTDWILDGAAIETKISTVVDGKKQPPSKELMVWDPDKKEIAHVIVDASGFFGGGTWRHEGGDWFLDWEVATGGDGYSGTSLHREKEGDVFEWQMTHVKQGDKNLPDWPLVSFHRSTTTEKQWLDYMKGTWTTTFEDGRTGKVEFVPAVHAPALTFNGEMKDFSIAGVFGWHEGQQIFREVDFGSNLGEQMFLERQFEHITPQTLSGVQTWWDSEKGEGSQALEYRRINENEMTLSGKASDSGGTDWVVRFKR
jgi:hypothetical protein